MFINSANLKLHPVSVIGLGSRDVKYHKNPRKSQPGRILEGKNKNVRTYEIDFL